MDILPMTDQTVKQAKAQQFADQVEVLANVIASMGDVHWPTLTAEQRRFRLHQARRILREHEKAASLVAWHRCEQAAAKVYQELALGDRQVISDVETRIATEMARAAVLAYQTSLEGLADERQADPAFDARMEGV